MNLRTTTLLNMNVLCCCFCSCVCLDKNIIFTDKPQLHIEIAEYMCSLLMLLYYAVITVQCHIFEVIILWQKKLAERRSIAHAK